MRQGRISEHFLVFTPFWPTIVKIGFFRRVSVSHKSKMVAKKARSAIKDVISREYTINLHKVRFELKRGRDLTLLKIEFD